MTSEPAKALDDHTLAQLRAQFPILRERVNGQPLVYLDNAATTQKPQAVLDALSHYYQTANANVHRGAHALADLATREFEQARERVRGYLNAPLAEQIIWTRGTTEAINLVAFSYAQAFLKPGDEILISAMEHHSNIVPWQISAEITGATLRVIPVTPQGELQLETLDALLSERTKLVSLVHVSNALGTINPIKQVIDKAHAVGAVVMIDGAQAVPHWSIDVQALDCDFYAFSGHKLYGPTGIGALYGKQALLNAMRPYQSGGEMIETVAFDATRYNALPYKFEAGTPNIAGAIGLGVAIDFLNQLDRAALVAHEHALLARANQLSQDLPGLRLIGTATHKASVFSFLLDGAHPHDVGTLLDQQGIAVRTGHHCAMPIMAQYQIPGTVRASFSFYNTLDEVDTLFSGLRKARELLL